MFRFLLAFLLLCFIYFVQKIGSCVQSAKSKDVKGRICCLGYAFPSLEPHIVGGFDIDIKKAPYQAALVYPLGCGAVVVSEKYLITAAHCCSRGWKARLGSNYHSKGGTIIDIKKQTKHPKYNETRSLDYDVCVLEAENKIVFGETVKPIPIAEKEPNPDDIVRVSGWGRIAENGNLSPILKAVDIPVTNRTYCKKAYSSLTERMICAGVEGKDSCQGDSGGPLTFNGKLVAVVSFGKGCAVKNYPGVYALLTNTEIRQFIKKITGV